MTTVAAAETYARPGRPTPILASVATITARNLRRLIRVPTLLVFATVQPVLFALLFTYAFGGAIHVPGVAHYIDYLLPSIFVLAIGFGASQTGVAIAEDLTTGMIDRFRSLPITAAAVLAGRVAAEALRNLFVVALAVATGLAFSWLNPLLGLARPRARIRRAGRPVPDHHPVLHQIHPGAGGQHARLASGLRQGQPRHRHHRRPARSPPEPDRRPGGNHHAAST
jgi:ABC-2 type transporter